MNRFEFNSNLIDFKNKQDELAHYGTKGQRWGVRKWQNYDGTFNEAGKERYFGKKSETFGSKKTPEEKEQRQQEKFDKKVNYWVNRQKKQIERYNKSPFHKNKQINIDDDTLKGYYESLWSLPWYKRTHKNAVEEYKKRNGITMSDEDIKNLKKMHDVDSQNRMNQINRLNEQMRQAEELNRMIQLQQIDQLNQLDQINQLNTMNQVAMNNMIMPGFMGKSEKFGTARNPKLNLKVDPELLKEYSEDEIEDSIQSVVNDIRSKAPEGLEYDPSSYDVTVDKDGSFHINFHYDDSPKDNSKINWKQLDESNRDSYGKSEEQYWKDKEKAEKYLDENYDKDFASVIKDDYDTSGEWGDVDAAYEQFKQNPYEYLKKYSRDPKYNLSPKEEKALQKEADKIDKDIMKNKMSIRDFINSDNCTDVKNMATESVNKNCMDELKDLTDIFKDYKYHNYDYSALAGITNALEHPYFGKNMGDISNAIIGYVYDDFDQGYGNSAAIYLYDKGYSADQISKISERNLNNRDNVKNDISISIEKDPLLSKLNKANKIRIRNWMEDDASYFLINDEDKRNKEGDHYSYDTYSMWVGNADDGIRSNKTEKSDKYLPEAKKIFNKVSKTCNSVNDGWWYLNQAIDELGYSNINYKDLTDSDWNKINAKIKELG